MPAVARPLESATTVLTALAAVAVLFSIAASQALFGVALVLVLIMVATRSRRHLEFNPRILWPILCFMVWTCLSVAFSDAPLSGLSQIRKLVLFLIVVIVYNAFASRRQIRWTFQAMMVAAALVSLLGVGQFVRDYVQLTRAGLPFYGNYVTHQITGFMSHWMTYGGELMLVAVLLVGLLLFAEPGAYIGEMSPWWWLCFPPIVAALLGSFTRGIWLATLAGITYLLARSRRPLLCIVIPAGVLLLYVLSPNWLRERERSIFDVEADSSNRARIVMLRTGMNMIEAHPVFGVGPERVGPEFLAYKPTSMELPAGWYGHLHNDYMQIAAERGLPCLLILLWFFYEVFREGILLGRSRSTSVRPMGHCAVAITVALMVGGLFEFNFGDSEVLMLYLFLISAAYTWPRLPDAEPAENNASRTVTATT